MLKIFVGVILAIFAVIGFYDVIRCFAVRAFDSGTVVLSILVRNSRDVECLETTIRDHISCALITKSQRIFLLIAEEIADDPKISELALKYGVERYITRKID